MITKSQFQLLGKVVRIVKKEGVKTKEGKQLYNVYFQISFGTTEAPINKIIQLSYYSSLSQIVLVKRYLLHSQVLCVGYITSYTFEDDIKGKEVSVNKLVIDNMFCNDSLTREEIKKELKEVKKIDDEMEGSDSLASECYEE